MNLNVAIIGCGFWGRHHARVYNDLENASLVAIADIDGNRAKEIGEKYGLDWYSNPQDVFERPDIEAVSICTPTITHAEIALRALEAGKHVLVEKPMTNTLEEAETLIRAAESHGVHLAVGFIERFNPAVQEASKIINEGMIGDVILAHTRRVSQRPLRIGDVGVIKDLAIHDIDIVNQLFKAEAVNVFATAGSIRHDFEDYANIVMCFPGKKGAFVETNWLTPRKVRTLTVTGTNGIINVEYIDQKITIENEEQMIQPFIEYREPLKLELQSFIDSILNDKPPLVGGEDGLKALLVCEAALLSAKNGKPVNINSSSLKARANRSITCA